MVPMLSQLSQLLVTTLLAVTPPVAPAGAPAAKPATQPSTPSSSTIGVLPGLPAGDNATSATMATTKPGDFNHLVVTANNRLRSAREANLPTRKDLFDGSVDVRMQLAQVRPLDGQHLELLGTILIDRTVQYNVTKDHGVIDTAKRSLEQAEDAADRAARTERAARQQADLEVRNFETSRRWDKRRQLWIHRGSQCRNPPQTAEARQIAYNKLMAKWTAEVEKRTTATREARQAVASAKATLKAARATFDANRKAAIEEAKTITVRAIVPCSSGEQEAQRKALGKMQVVRILGVVEDFEAAFDSETILKPTRHVKQVTLRGNLKRSADAIE